jgi:ribose transport system ATP-binding protein
MVLKVDGDPLLSTAGLRGITLRSLSFDARAGEIIGIAGLEGSGREEVGKLLGGALESRGGTIIVDGTPIARQTPRAALQSGLVYVAADRKKESAIPSLNVRENVTLTRIPKFGRILNWISYKAERKDAQEWLGRAGAPPGKVDDPLSTLSGGNQQKVVLARAMRSLPRVLVVDQPLQGIDVGARAAIVEKLRQAASEGLAVLVASSESSDLEAMCTRVLVLRRGRVSASLTGSDISEAAIARHSIGDELAPEH